MLSNTETLWKKAVEFHGHICPGLMIGFRAALYAANLLELSFSEDEEVVCISENDACGVDAIQAILGCTVGKGNLLFHIRGKQAFSFYNRQSNHSVRLVLKQKSYHMNREESLAYYESCEDSEMFTVKETTLPLPEKARIYESVKCEFCGEMTGSRWIKERNGKNYCLDCFKKTKM